MRYNFTIQSVEDNTLMVIKSATKEALLKSLKSFIGDLESDTSSKKTASKSCKKLVS